VGATASASRQLVHRARRKLADERPPEVVTNDGLGAVVDAFVAACASGDVDALLRTLAPDVVLVSDGGAERRAARHPILGPDRVSRFLLTLTRRMRPGVELSFPVVNGEPAVLMRWSPGEELLVVLEASAEGVRRVLMVVAPAKLARFDEPAHLV